MFIICVYLYKSSMFNIMCINGEDAARSVKLVSDPFVLFEQ